MPDIADAYDQWADQYDTNQNKTCDLEGHALLHPHVLTLLFQKMQLVS